MLACQISKWRGWIGNLIVWTPMKPLKKEACVLVLGTKCTHTQYVETPTATQKKRGEMYRDKKIRVFMFWVAHHKATKCAQHMGPDLSATLPSPKGRRGRREEGKTWWSSSPSSSSCYWAGEETSGFPQTATRRRIWQRTGGTGTTATMKLSRIFCFFIGIAFSAAAASSEGELKVETLAESTNCEKVINKPPF